MVRTADLTALDGLELRLFTDWTDDRLFPSNGGLGHQQFDPGDHDMRVGFPDHALDDADRRCRGRSLSIASFVRARVACVVA